MDKVRVWAARELDAQSLDAENSMIVPVIVQVRPGTPIMPALDRHIGMSQNSQINSAGRQTP